MYPITKKIREQLTVAPCTDTILHDVIMKEVPTMHLEMITSTLRRMIVSGELTRKGALYSLTGMPPITPEIPTVSLPVTQMIKEKVCTCCNKTRSIDDFQAVRGGGKGKVCKYCRRENISKGIKASQDRGSTNKSPQRAYAERHPEEQKPIDDSTPETAPIVRPIPMLLWCPGCGHRHIDIGEFAGTKIHHTHACQLCGMVWRPAIEATVGVQFLPGFKNEGETK